MNYIKRLEQEKAQHQAAILDGYISIQDKLRFLNTDKFNGVCPIDGARKDWIATSDVITMLQDIKASIANRLY